jgi:Fic family protein
MRRDGLCHAVRQRLERLPPPYDAHYGVIPLPPPETAVALGAAADLCRAADDAMTRVDIYAAELHDPFVISRVLARREAVTSSIIEGTQSTLDEVLALEESADDEARAAARQVRNYALVLETLLPRAREERHAIFTPGLVRRLHREVMRDDEEFRGEPGVLRERPVWIGGFDIAYSTYNPTPPARIAACLADTLDYLRNEGMQAMRQGLITRMAIGHAHFEAVHPFLDGNGRVGRLLLPLMLAAEQRTPLYLSPYIEAHKESYYDALRAAQQQLDWSAIVGLMARATTGTVDELMATRHAFASLTTIWRARGRLRRGSAAERALAMLPHYPIVTIGRLASILDVSFPAASSAVARLVDLGILAERTGYRRNRLFAATEALSILNRPFGADPILPLS